jgi:D-inositol-3-phosphate glycosyltransferase
MTDGKAQQAAPPRVLIVSPYAFPHIGGIEVLVEQQARVLADLGHKVTVVTSRYGRTTARGERRYNYEVVRIPAWNGLEKRFGIPFPVWSPTGIWRLARLIGQADIVHAHDAYYISSMLAGILSWLRRRPFFMTQHVAIVMHSIAAVMLIQKVIYGSAGRLLWGFARSVTVYNNIVRDFVSGYGIPPEKLRVVNNGIDTSEFRRGTEEGKQFIREKYGLPQDRPVILFAGRLVHKKGFQHLLEACGPEYELVLAGPGMIPDHVPPGVTFVGSVDRQDLRGLYQASDIFVLPAVGEMFTLVMQEAMACGLPVVTTNETAYADYGLDPDGIALVEPEPHVLRATFLDLITDTPRMLYMQAYSRKLAEERFDWLKNAGFLSADYLTAHEGRRQRLLASIPWQSQAPSSADEPTEVVTNSMN